MAAVDACRDVAVEVREFPPCVEAPLAPEVIDACCGVGLDLNLDAILDRADGQGLPGAFPFATPVGAELEVFLSGAGGAFWPSHAPRRLLVASGKPQRGLPRSQKRRRLLVSEGEGARSA